MQQTLVNEDLEARHRAVARIRATGTPIRSVEELYGPGPGPDDPEDLDAFLALLAQQRQPVRIPGDAEG
jgi:hypothetical protein